jgi:hypothetical protein
MFHSLPISDLLFSWHEISAHFTEHGENLKVYILGVQDTPFSIYELDYKRGTVFALPSFPHRLSHESRCILRRNVLYCFLVQKDAQSLTKSTLIGHVLDTQSPEAGWNPLPPWYFRTAPFIGKLSFETTWDCSDTSPCQCRKPSDMRIENIILDNHRLLFLLVLDFTPRPHGDTVWILLRLDLRVLQWLPYEILSENKSFWPRYSLKMLQF